MPPIALAQISIEADAITPPPLPTRDERIAIRRASSEAYRQQARDLRARADAADRAADYQDDMIVAIQDGEA